MTRSQTPWLLVDLFSFESLRTPADTVRMDSEGMVINLLKHHARQLPHEVQLIAPSGAMLFIAVGGPLAALHYYPDAESTVGLAAVAPTILTPRPEYFTSNGQPLEIQPDRLLPLETAIQTALIFYKTQDLPHQLQWEEE
jgi:hypothetical protein